MRKLLLTLVATAAVIIGAQAQSCTPGANFADSTFGAWPDTITNFPPATTGLAYSTDLNFKVPDQVTAELDPTGGTLVGSTIQDFVVTGVTGLPTGFDYACNIASCTYAGGANGCANLYGITNTAGTFDVQIDVDATIIIDVFGIPTPVQQSTSFTGYKINVGSAGLIEQIILPISVFPNPANESITIQGITTSTKAERLDIVDLNGNVISTVENPTQDVTIEISDLKAGMYFVKVHHVSGTEIVKFIKE
jgi:hypothetical protein